MIPAAPRNQGRTTVQSIEEYTELVEYESGYLMGEGRGIELPLTLERSPGTAMPSVPDSASEVQNETAASSSKRPVIDQTKTSNSAFVQRGVKRKSTGPETPRKVQKTGLHDSNNIERETQKRNLMAPPPARRAAIRGQERTKDMFNFFRQPSREISAALEDYRTAPIISCHCNQSNCPTCSFRNSRDDKE